MWPRQSGPPSEVLGGAAPLLHAVIAGLCAEPCSQESGAAVPAL